MSSHFYGNSLKLENVYIASTGSVCGPLEFQGPLGHILIRAILIIIVMRILLKRLNVKCYAML